MIVKSRPVTRQPARELDLATLATASGGGFEDAVAYVVGRMFGGAIEAYAKNPPTWDNGKI